MVSSKGGSGPPHLRPDRRHCLRGSSATASAALQVVLKRRPEGPVYGFDQRSGQIEAIRVHHLGPGRHEVAHELLLGVVAGVDLGQRPQLRVRAEDEVDAGAGPLRLRRSCGRGPRTRPWRPRPPSTPCPCRAGSRRSRWSASPGVLVKTPCWRLAGVGVQHAQAADEHRHLRRGQRQQLRLVDQQLPRPARRTASSGSCGSRRRPARAPRRTRRRSAPARHRCGPARRAPRP